MKISAIVAVGQNGEIGRGGAMPWPHLRKDMRWFAERTRGKPVIMGRKTWDSLPSSPLPGRPNIVLTRSWPGRSGPIRQLGCDLVSHPEEALDAARDYLATEVFVIGGASVYRAFLPMMTTIYLTKVDGSYQGADAFFPYPLPAAQWEEHACHDRWFADPDSGLRFGFYRYIRRPEPSL